MRQQRATADIASNNRPMTGMAKADLRNYSFAANYASECCISDIPKTPHQNEPTTTPRQESYPLASRKSTVQIF